MFTINSIKFHNFRNIFDSEIKLSGSEKKSFFNSLGGSVVGIYGQNSTSKSSVGYALNLLQTLCLGINFSPFHNHNDDFGISDSVMSLEFDFSHTMSNCDFKGLKLRFEFQKKDDESFYISDEKITFLTGESKRPSSIEIKRSVDTPMSSFEASIKSVSDYFNCSILDLVNEISLCNQERRSIFLSYGFLKKILEINKSKAKKEITYLVDFYLAITSKMVIIMQDSYCFSISNSCLPCYGSDFISTNFYLSHDTSNSITVNASQLEEINTAVERSNAFLEKIIKGFKVKFISKEFINDKGEKTFTGKLFSLKKNGKIAFSNESEGIKRIFFIAAAIARSTNENDFIVFVDELDEGIFEVLLGELISKIYELTLGQFIFTSHNLRPLEVIPYGNFIFSTTDSSNRFVTFTGVKPTNNFRDLYMNRIMYGNKNDSFAYLVKETDLLEGLINAGRRN